MMQILEILISLVARPRSKAAEQSEWMHPWRRWSDWDVSVGLTDTYIEDSALRLNASNLFGLHINGMLIVWSNSPSSSVLINPGEELPATEGRLYMRTAQPQLETLDYYFARKYSAPVPGHAEFSATNTTPLIIAALGDGTFQLGGWAKQRIVNGYSDKFAYLGQYFEKAYKVDSSGQTTTNETGILSPYGEFMPLEPGPTALVTMTNWGVNERGTAVVHVISMSVDANHDGVMDLVHTGQDATTYYHPFRFWLNNDYDRGHNVDCLPFCDWEEDDLLTAGCPYTPNKMTPGFRPMPSVPSLRSEAFPLRSHRRW